MWDQNPNPSRPNHKSHFMQASEDERRAMAETNKRKFNQNRRAKFKAPVVKTTDDIKRVLIALGAGIPGANISAIVDVYDENGGKQSKVQVNSNSPSKTKFAILQEGLKIFKERQNVSAERSEMTINRRKVKQPDIIGNPSSSWIDSIVERWTGGKRSDYLICWVVDGTKYYFDVFEMKLFAEDKE